MATKTSAYLDTSAFIALLDESDTYHPLFAPLFENPPPLLTTPLTISEAHAWFLRRYDQTKALQFMSFIEELSPLKIVDVGKADLVQSTKWIRKFPDQGLTLTDACGLWMMKKYSIGYCWSTDRHLNLTGVPLVIYE